MTEVGVKNLKDELSRYLRRAQKGERIVVTDRGEPIAVLSPVEESPAQRTAWELVKEQRARWSGGKPRGSRVSLREGARSMADLVLEQRR